MINGKCENYKIPKRRSMASFKGETKMNLQDLSRRSNILSSRIDFVPAKGENQVDHFRKKSFPLQQTIALQLEWKKVKTIGPGLVNMGNTCFLNAVLQCLTYIPALAQALYSRHDCSSRSSCTLFSLEEHFKMMSKSTQPVVPKVILSKLRIISKSLKLGRQEDAHEFLLGLLGSLQNNCMGRKNTMPNIVKSIFNGSIQSVVKCRMCKYESKTIDPILDIALDIKNCPNLKTAFSIYTKKELLSGGNRCKKQVDAQKQLKIQQEPFVLIIQLKRFGFMGNYGSKMNNHVAFESEFDLAPFMEDKSKSAKYQLIGVVVHSGFSTNSGHYYSFVKASNGIWYCMNDTSVSQVSLQNVLSQKAYILFYSKREGISNTPIANPIKSLPTPPLSPVVAPKKPQLIEKKDNVLEPEMKKSGDKSEKEGKSDNSVDRNIQEPGPITLKSSKLPTAGREVIKNLEKQAEKSNCNATSKSWKVQPKCGKDDPIEDKKRVKVFPSDAKLLPASLPELMQHFSPVSVLNWNNSEAEFKLSNKKLKRKDAHDILYDQGKIPKYLKRQAMKNVIQKRE